MPSILPICSRRQFRLAHPVPPPVVALPRSLFFPASSAPHTPLSKHVPQATGPIRRQTARNASAFKTPLHFPLPPFGEARIPHRSYYEMHTNRDVMALRIHRSPGPRGPAFVPLCWLQLLQLLCYCLLPLSALCRGGMIVRRWRAVHTTLHRRLMLLQEQDRRKRVWCRHTLLQSRPCGLIVSPITYELGPFSSPLFSFLVPRDQPG